MKAVQPGYFAKTHVTVNGYDVVEEVAGDESRAVVLLIHGIGVSTDYFEAFARELCKNYRVVMLDLPGYGDAQQPERDLSIPELAAVVNSYLELKGISGVIAAGHSMGSQIIARAATSAPKLYKKVILMSPTINAKERRFWIQAWRLMQDIPREKPHTIWVVTKNYLQMGLVSYLKVTRSMLSDKIEQQVTKIHIPVLVMQGTKDPVVPSYWAEYLRDTAPNGQLAVVEGVPHNFQCTVPVEAARLCQEFIEK